MAVTITSAGTIYTPPAADPAFLAYLRAQGMDESEIAGEIARRTSSLNRGLNRRLPQYAEDKEVALESTSDNYENRGLFRSGERLTDQQRVASGYDRQMLEDVTNTTDSIADANMSGARQVAALRRSTAEREMDERGRVY